jgi:methylenetetrahydrofolate--tRNA-(uracil-5-)-methyltransferase
MSEDRVSIIGAGLAGSEAAWQAVRRGLKVVLYEMRPDRMTPAHKTGAAAELVCSNSLGGSATTVAKGVLQEEMRRLKSLIMEAAERWKVPAGGALAVDRQKFAEYIESRLEGEENIQIVRGEVTEIPPGPVIIAAGPLVSEALAAEIGRIIGDKFLHFVDAISPIIDAQSIDYDVVYAASRYGKGGADYLNCPMTEQQYDDFRQAVMDADKVPPKEFENEKKLYEACLPIEELAARGRLTLAFGPCKPVGLEHPETGKRPFAVVQLRRDDLDGTSYNIVGFQTKMTYGAQQETLRLIPGLEKAEFLRLGSVHRNTYLNAPALLDEYLRLKADPRIMFAGQIAGSEGYLESTSLGLFAGINISCLLRGETPTIPPSDTAIGSLLRALRESDAENFDPVGMQFGLFPPLPGRHGKKDRKRLRAERALESIGKYVTAVL